MGETSYASCGDLSLAYQVFGDGPVELVFVGPMVTHVELFWTLPECKAFFEQLATFCRVLLFDKAGVGLSDPIPKVRLLEDRAAEIEAEPKAAMDTVLAILTEHQDTVRGITVSVLDPAIEVALRERTPDPVRVFTGDDYNYVDLIAGDGSHTSDALLVPRALRHNAFRRK